MLVLVVGPSGAGKDTLLDLARAELADDKRVRFIRREITRPANAGGEDHIAITAEQFAARRGQYALSWQAHGLGYGIQADIADDLAAGHVVVANISRAVIGEAAARFAVHVLEITAPPVVLAQRLAARGRETEADITARLAREVALPSGVAVTRVMNDRTLAEGAAAVMACLVRLAQASHPGLRPE